MMRALPRTLFGQMVLILVAGFVAAQVLATAIFLQDRDRLSLRAVSRHSGTRIADLVKILERLPVSERPIVAEATQRQGFSLSLSAPPVDVKDAASGPDNQAAVVAAELRRYLGSTRELRVAVNEEDSVETDRSGTRKSLVQVRLQDGSWASFIFRVNEPSGFPTSRQFWLSMLLRLVAVILLSLLAVRLVTRPLQTLADAAEELGKNIYRPPLREHGTVEVRRAAHAFNTMQARLVQYIRERTRILAAVSHDLRTPITRLRLRAALLRDPEAQAKFAADLEEMEAMVTATLDFMHGLENTESLHPVDIMALLESLQADALELGQQVEIQGSVTRPLMAYPQALKRCISNVLQNAVKYGKRANIVVEDSERELRVSVCDEGPGIPEKEMEKVFEPYYRVESSRNRATGGTGLGLTIARNGARSLGGELLLRNRPEGGLHATLVLPRPLS
jgi:signal transduction histidine kinase